MLIEEVAMNKDQTADPSGTYDVDEVTMTADDEPIAKGEGATGTFLDVGRDGTHFRTTTGTDGSAARGTVRDPRRPLAIVLLRSSAGNAVLRDIRATGRLARLRVERRLDGAVLLFAQVLTVDDGSPRDVSHGELRWNLTVVG
jgi:hypothetical protein